MQEICPKCLKFVYVTHSSVVARKLVEGQVMSNRLHELYLWFTAFRLRGLSTRNSHVTLKPGPTLIETFLTIKT